jgi:hypothetical protein
MRVEVDDGDGAVGAGDAAEEREGDGVVAAEGDDAGEGLALEGWALPVGVGRGRPAQDAVVAVLDLLDGVGVVVPSTPISPGSFRSRRGHLRKLTTSRGYPRNRAPWPSCGTGSRPAGRCTRR